LADVDIKVSLGGKANKPTPVDADKFHLNDSAAADVLKTTLFSDIKTTLAAATQTLTNKTVNLASNTVTGTTAEFNTALSDGSFATLAGSETLTNKTLTSPRVGTAIGDANGNELIKVTATGSAVNEITVANAATGSGPTISATGDDANIDVNLTPKGSGKVNIGGTGAGIVGIKDSDASHYLNITTASNLTADRTLTINPGDSARTLTLSGDATLPAGTAVVTSSLGTDVATQLANAANGSDVEGIGYRGIPQNSKSAAYTTVMADAGKHIFHPSSDANARTFTIDSNANVAYEIGTAITFINQTSQVVTIAITADTLTLAGSTTTGSRSLAQNGVATAIKVASTSWIISGTGLT
jgi:hypothetical protein